MMSQHFKNIATVIIAAGIIWAFIYINPDTSRAQPMSPTVRAQVIPFSVERDNITTASVNLAFGFTSGVITIEAGTANTAVIAVDWTGATAICPAINTSGDTRMPVGRIITKDDWSVTSISVIACSGTQSVIITAWQ